MSLAKLIEKGGGVAVLLVVLRNSLVWWLCGKRKCIPYYNRPRGMELEGKAIIGGPVEFLCRASQPCAGARQY